MCSGLAIIIFLIVLTYFYDLKSVFMNNNSDNSPSKRSKQTESKKSGKGRKNDKES